MKGNERIKEQAKTASKAIEELEKQIKNMDLVFQDTLKNLEGEEREKIQEVKVLTDRAILLAREGGDYKKVIDQIRNQVKNRI